jgi:ketosteroid isomerase-like protein
MKPAQAIRAVMTGWERLDPQQVAELFADQGTYDDPLKDGRLVGPSAILEANEKAMHDLLSCRIELSHVVETDQVALAEGEFHAVLRAGGTLAFSFAVVLEVADGKVTRLAEYFDTRPLLA